ncbi:MAG: CoA pyrophosphatase [Burkholderiaceae bacterium]|nr:CoA pyrophosphatase [Burkholderiaceae bacterium]
MSFDPRAVAAIGTDSHLPALPPERLTPACLRARLGAPPPAWESQAWQEPRWGDQQAPPLVPAAVLLPLLPGGEAGGGGDDQALDVLLTQRTLHLSTHSGQIAFPGGQVDAADASAVATALREAEEEVGLERDFVEVIGTLPTYCTGTRFAITPVVALVRPGYAIRPNPQEVDDVFAVPLAWLMNPAHHRRHALRVQGQRREWYSMPYPEPRQDGAREPHTERFIWGATAAMLRNLYRLLAA